MTNTMKSTWFNLGKKHCKLNRLPYLGMPEDYYLGYSEQVDETQ